MPTTNANRLGPASCHSAPDPAVSLSTSGTSLGPVVWTLTCIAGSAVPERVVLDGPVVIGRDPHCDVRVRDDRTSRFHAQLMPATNGVVVTDRDSANGTWSGERRLTEDSLSDGDLLGIGGAVFVVATNTGHGSVVSDDGNALKLTSEHPTRAWQPGDDPHALAAVHQALHQVLSQPTATRAKALAATIGQLVGAGRAALIWRQRVIGDLAPALTRRLADGNQARLWQLGHDLAGATIAREAIGSALSAPLSTEGHLIAVRGLDDEPFGSAELNRLALFAAEAPAALAGVAPAPGEPSPAPAHPATAALVGDSPPMHQLRGRIQRLATTDATVLVTGESGTGKELVARALHQASGRAGGPLITVNCAAVAENLFEAELFGHERGAFTGADQARPGRIRRADGGSLFLDEIGELPLPMQAKLLRVLQEGEVEPVGGGTTVSVDVRVIAATNRDLAAEVAAGRFREDLYFRLDVLRVRTPALRERLADLPALAQHLAARAADELGLPAPALDADAIAHLQSATWPGNVRQLANSLTRAVAMAASHVLTATDFELDSAAAPAVPPQPDTGPFPTLAAVELAHVRAALARTGWNRSQAARLLGISRPTLLKKITANGLQPPETGSKPA